jgi:hypothetical protein
MKIPFYFDNKTDPYKNNAMDKKFNHRFYPSYEGLFKKSFPDCILKDIVEVDNTYNDKYFYPINLYYTLFHFMDQYDLSIPLKVLNDIKEKKCKLLMICIYEGYELDRFENLIKNKILIPFDIKYSDVILITGNLDKCSKHGLKNIYYNHWESIIKFYNEELFKQMLDNIFSDDLRTNKFICLQRRPKTQRLMLYTELYDYRTQGILTMGIGDNINSLEQIIEIENSYFLDRKIFRRYQKKNLRNTLPCEYDVKLALENPTHDQKIDKYLDSYLHVVSETYFENHENQMFFSEKIYKPMIFLQPFILFGQTHSLKSLHNLGFKTFHSKYINESYDNIKDDRERFLAATKQVKQIISLERKELHDMMRSFSDTLIYNYNHLNSRYYNNKCVYKELLSIMYYW